MCLLRGTDLIFIYKSTFCSHSVFTCFVWIWEEAEITSLYSIYWLVFITETDCVYCAVRTGCLNTIRFRISSQKVTGSISSHLQYSHIRHRVLKDRSIMRYGTRFNPLTQSGNYTYRPFEHSDTLHFLHIVQICYTSHPHKNNCISEQHYPVSPYKALHSEPRNELPQANYVTFSLMADNGDPGSIPD